VRAQSRDISRECCTFNGFVTVCPFERLTGAGTSDRLHTTVSGVFTPVAIRMGRFVRLFRTLARSYSGPFARGTFRIFVPGMFVHVELRHDGSDACRARTIGRLPSNPGNKGVRHDPRHDQTLVVRAHGLNPGTVDVYVVCKHFTTPEFVVKDLNSTVWLVRTGPVRKVLCTKGLSTNGPRMKTVYIAILGFFISP